MSIVCNFILQLFLYVADKIMNLHLTTLFNIARRSWSRPTRYHAVFSVFAPSPKVIKISDLWSVKANFSVVAGTDGKRPVVTFDTDVIGRKVWTQHERHTNTSTAAVVANRHDARPDRSPLRRQVKRHLHVKDAFVRQLAVDHLVVDVLGQVELAYHGLLEDGTLTVIEALSYQ